MTRVMKELITKYDSELNLMVISLYPKKGEIYSKGVTGVASYAKNTATNMSRNVVVLADYENKPELYEEQNTLVNRCFKKGNPLMWASLLKAVLHFSHIKNVLLQYDFAMYGNILTSSLITAFSGILKLLGYKVYIVNHHVVSDVNKLSGHIGLTTSIADQVKAIIYNIVFHSFYKVLGAFSHKIIVLEEPLKLRLSHYVHANDIITIPHAVDSTIKSMPKSKARKLLGIPDDELVVVFFGFVNWFKGGDFFARVTSDISKLLGKKIRFIIAGGESITLKDKKYYQEYFSKVEDTVKKSKNVTMTGYVPQKMIPAYFSAADLITFPYREFMCASGVLSLTFSNKRPFIISDRLKGMLEAPDFKNGLKTVNLNKRDITFQLNKKSFYNVMKHVLHNGLKKKSVQLAEYMRLERSFKKNAALYEYVIFHPEYHTNPTKLFRYTHSYAQ